MSQPHVPVKADIDRFMREAINQAKLGFKEGGIPIGSVLVRNGEIISRGYNRRVQDGDPTAHAEINCLRNAGRVGPYHDTILFSTLMPCAMCAGMVIQFQIPIVIAGEDRTFLSALTWLWHKRVKVVDLDMDECYELLQRFAKAKPEIWNEDIGEL
jgi:cytosine deaminase